jgi:hypothetical protein
MLGRCGVRKWRRPRPRRDWPSRCLTSCLGLAESHTCPAAPIQQPPSISFVLCARPLAAHFSRRPAKLARSLLRWLASVQVNRRSPPRWPPRPARDFWPRLLAGIYALALVRLACHACVLRLLAYMLSLAVCTVQVHISLWLVFTFCFGFSTTILNFLLQVWFLKLLKKTLSVWLIVYSLRFYS